MNTFLRPKKLLAFHCELLIVLLYCEFVIYFSSCKKIIWFVGSFQWWFVGRLRQECWVGSSMRMVLVSNIHSLSLSVGLMIIWSTLRIFLVYIFSFWIIGTDVIAGHIKNHFLDKYFRRNGKRIQKSNAERRWRIKFSNNYRFIFFRWWHFQAERYFGTAVKFCSLCKTSRSWISCSFLCVFMRLLLIHL